MYEDYNNLFDISRSEDENVKFLDYPLIEGKNATEFIFEDINNDFDDFNQNQIVRTYFVSRKKPGQVNINKTFIIQKIKKEKIKKKGRRNSKETFLFESKHDKNSSDNIRKKIKRQFIKSIIKYINQLYIKYLLQKNKKSKILIYKIIPDFCNASKKEDNNKYLSMTLRELFSSDLGNKFKNINKDYNKNNIEKLYKKNKPEEIIKFLNKTIKEAYEIYINDEIPDFSLYNDLKEIEKNNGIDDANIFKARAKKLIENTKKIEE